jgi:putative membrane protein
MAHTRAMTGGQSITAALTALTMMAVSACAKRDAAVTDCADFVISPSQFQMQFYGPAGTVTQQELTFICRATVFGMAQVTVAQMALVRAEHPGVRHVGQKVVEEQERMNRVLRLVATEQDGMKPPDALDESGIAMLDRLARLSDGAFDRAYMQITVDETQSAVADFREEATLGVEPTLLRFAVKSLPLLEARLELAQGLAARLANELPRAPEAR